MKQKFFRGQWVRIATKFPQCMSRFDGKGCEAIIVASYSDLYGHGNFSDFELLIIPKNKKHRPFVSAWYSEDLLTLISDSRRVGEEMIQKHNEYWNNHPDGD